VNQAAINQTRVVCLAVTGGHTAKLQNVRAVKREFGRMLEARIRLKQACELS
jgi:hypothetical protein